MSATVLAKQEKTKIPTDTVMGLDTKIYSNHNLIIPSKSEEVIELLMQSWKGRTKIHDIENHTWLRPDGIRNIKGDVWFYKKENNIKKEAWL